VTVRDRETIGLGDRMFGFKPDPAGFDVAEGAGVQAGRITGISVKERPPSHRYG